MTTTRANQTKAILQAIAVTAELTDTTLSGPAIAQMASDLAGYSADAVLAALTRCRKELHRRLTLGDIIDRIEDSDGHPAADEAWSLAVTANDETATVVWTDEIAQAWGAAKPILDLGDDVGARMAFRAAYQRRVDSARANATRPRWIPSLGTDPELRQLAIADAVQQGRLRQDAVAAYLPPPDRAEATAMLAGLLTSTKH